MLFKLKIDKIVSYEFPLKNMKEKYEFPSEQSTWLEIRNSLLPEFEIKIPLPGLEPHSMS